MNSKAIRSCIRIFTIIAMFLALLPVTAILVRAAGNVVNVTINSDGTCKEGTSGTGYSACVVNSLQDTEITVDSGYTLVVSNPYMSILENQCMGS